MSSVLTSDETLVCASCHQAFVFSAEEKTAHERNGYQNKPKRCRPCREARRNGNQSKPMPDSETMIEVCKAVGELRVFLEHKLNDIDSRLTSIEEKIKSGGS